jgi:signal transduction histidine kinase
LSLHEIVQFESAVAVAGRGVALQRRPEDVLEAATNAVRDVLGTDAGLAAIVDPADAASGVSDRRMPLVVVRRGQGLGGAVLVTNRPARVDDYGRDAGISADFVDIVERSEGIHAMACVPVRDVSGRPVGLLYGANRSVGSLDDRALEVLSEIAVFAGIGLQHALDRRRELELQRQHDRQRLATDLHSSVAQSLFTIGVLARRSAVSRGSGPHRALHDIDQCAAEARQSLRRTLDDLSSADDGLSFDVRLDGEAELSERLTGCVVRVIRRGDAQAVPQAVEDLALDVVREGVRNAIKHQAARLCVVGTEYTPTELRVTVQGETRTPAPSSFGSGTGVGLEMLRRRARHLRGDVALEVHPDASPVLRLRVPVTATPPVVACES